MASDVSRGGGRVWRAPLSVEERPIPATAQRAAARQLWLTPLVVGAGARLVYTLAIPQVPPHADAAFYWQTAQNLAAGLGYTIHGHAATEWMPGLPLVLALVVLVTHGSLVAARLLMVAFSVAAIPLAATVASRRFDDRVARAAAWTFALYPPFWFFGASLLTESIAVLAVAATLVLVARLGDRFALAPALGLGACWATLLYVKPEFLAWGPLALGVALVWPRVLPRRAALVMCAVGALALSPWVMRNWNLFHEFIPLKANGGYLVWWAAQDPPIEAQEQLTPALAAVEDAMVVPGKPGATGKNMARAGMHLIAEHPLPYLEDCVRRRLVHLFLGSQCEAAAGGLDRSFSDARAAHAWGILAIKLVLFAIQGIISILGLLGVFLIRPKVARRIDFVLFGALVATYVLLLGITRYSMVLMPFLIPYGAALVYSTVDKRRARSAA